jgi:tRNA(Leu) C34 or U34 (ribose-2'-O)-methylase TrmL
MSSDQAPPALPAVILYNPKFGHNVGGALRTCSSFRVPTLLWTGKRVTLDVASGQRLPREERMKGYRDVDMRRHDAPFDLLPPGVVPVAVEVRPNAERLFDFEHPESAAYVFGPEDGSLPSWVLRHCHRFVVIPGAHCLNLSSAVLAVLYDRALKRYRDGLADVVLPGEFEGRGPEENTDVFVGVSSGSMGKIRRT